MILLRLALVMLCLSVTLARPSSAQVTPAPAQAPGALDGIDGAGFARLPAGSSGFVDAWSRCRYVGNGAGREEVLPISSAAEWLSWRSSPGPGDSQVVCCRPTTDVLCQGATGGTVVAPVNGSGVNGYGAYGGVGTATATCSDPPYGNYQDTRSYVCGQVGAGTDADGQWSRSGTDTNTCTPNSYITYGGCSTAGVGGWGSLYEVVYNSCGQVTNQGYFGPSCYTQPPCTPTGTSCGGCSGSCGGGWGWQTCSNGCSSWTQSCQNNNSCAPVLTGSYTCTPYTQPTGCASPAWETCGIIGNYDTTQYCNGRGPTWGPAWGTATSSGCTGGSYPVNQCVPEPDGSCANTGFNCYTVY